MKAFFKLIRWQNLLIVALTMILMRYAVIEPVISKIYVVLDNNPGVEVPLSLKFPWYNFLILIIATLCLTAGGYVINDYFDIKTDLINKGEVIVGTKIPRRKAILLHNGLNIAGVTAGFYLSWRAGYFWMGILFLIVSGLLYFYSASYKRQFLIGNIVVSLLTAMVPMLVVIYEWPPLYRFYAENTSDVPGLGIIFYWIGGFAVFAFLATLIREIIKDIEDFEGDQAYGRNTVPVITGIRTAKIIAVSLIVIMAGMLYAVWYYFLNDTITLVYVSGLVVLPLFFAIWLLITGKRRSELHRASRVLKIVMITGLLYSLVVKIMLSQNLI